MMPEVFKLEVIKQTSKQYQAVKTQIYRGMWGTLSLPRMQEGKESWWPG